MCSFRSARLWGSFSPKAGDYGLGRVRDLLQQRSEWILSMAEPSVRFESGDAVWVSERDSVSFAGLTVLGPVDFLITRDALAYILNPDLDEIDSETAIETFFEFESDIHRIARFEFVKRLGGEPPVLLTVSDIEAAGPFTPTAIAENEDYSDYT
jgi:hypothetical protein